MAAVDLSTLRDRVRAMERTTSVREPLSRSDVIDALLPGGVRAGCTYAVRGSHSLLATLLAGGSAEGRWCGLVGLPHLGVESAGQVGLDLSRTLAVPDPGESWAEVAATLVEALPLVGLHPTSAPTRADVTRLTARLRARSSALVVLATPDLHWPGLDATLVVDAQSWAGIEDSRGRLLTRDLYVEVTPRTGRPRRIHLTQQATGAICLPDAARFATGATPLPRVRQLPTRALPEAAAS